MRIFSLGDWKTPTPIANVGGYKNLKSPATALRRGFGESTNCQTVPRPYVSNSGQFGRIRCASMDGFGSARHSGDVVAKGLILRGSRFWRFYE